MNNFFATVYIALLTHCLFLSFIMFKKKANKKTNRLYGIFLLMLSFYLLFSYIPTITLKETPESINYSLIFLSLALPFFYFYGKSLIGKVILTRRIGIHFLPVTALLLYLLFFMNNRFLSTDELYLKNYSFHFLRIDSLLIIEMVLFLFIIYIVILFKFLSEHMEKVDNFYSSKELIRLKWFKIHLIFGLIVISSNFVTNIFDFIIWNERSLVVSILEVFCMTSLISFIFSMAYFTYIQEDITQSIKQMNTAEGIENLSIGNSPKYSKQRLDGVTEKRYLDRILDYMNTQKPFINPSLTLKQLADEVSLQPHQVTMIINIYLKKNYYNFINSYRVFEACKRMQSEEYINENLLTIAMDSGFNSKSTFNSFFKKNRGQTPSQYRRTILNRVTD